MSLAKYREMVLHTTPFKKKDTRKHPVQEKMPYSAFSF